jgi:hypothetical protein
MVAGFSGVQGTAADGCMANFIVENIIDGRGALLSCVNKCKAYLRIFSKHIIGLEVYKRYKCIYCCNLNHSVSTTLWRVIIVNYTQG